MIAHITKQWWKWGLFSLVLVALSGALMRYKIAFDFPFFNQKNLLHAHSHFAFSGWISHILYSVLTSMIAPLLALSRQKKYYYVVGLNIVSAFGMLVAFTIQGYKAVSISFSTLSIVVAVLYAILFIRDAKLLKGHPSRPWAIAGLLFNVLSALGPLYLAYIMASKNIDYNLYLGSVYYFLHFQYNGWFFFGGMAMAVWLLPKNFPDLRKYFYVFSFTAIPTFFLSILWVKLPIWLYSITVIAALLQLVAWAILLYKYLPLLKLKKKAGHLIFFYIAALAVTVKFVLQAISVLPSLSQLVFGFRPIVIAYLHLVLLGVYSLFIIGFLFAKGLINNYKIAFIGAIGFLVGVFLNELLLGIQGFAAFSYLPIPYINEMLFSAALVLLTSVAVLFCSQLRNPKSTP